MYNTPMAKKMIVTHQSPDIDAIGAVWLLRRFLGSEYADAQLAFVPAGTLVPLDYAAQFGIAERDIVHVDTGMGAFDHHQPERAQQHICATSLVYDFLCSQQTDKRQDLALKQVVAYITDVDHFGEARWPDPAHPRYVFMVHELLRGAQLTGFYDDVRLTQFGHELLDAAYAHLRVLTRADELIQTNGMTLRVAGLRTLAIATSSGEVEKRAQKLGFDIVVRKDEDRGPVRIKATPESGLDLTPTYERLLERDKVGTWFLHGSKRMLLNGSSKNGQQIPTPLSLVEVVKILKETLGDQEKA